jgi:hypothetical protein
MKMKILRNRLVVVLFVAAITLCGSTPARAYEWKNVMQKTSGSYIASLALSGSKKSWNEGIGLPSGTK